MSKNCANCDHKGVCALPPTANGKCNYWSGWHDVATDPPKVGMQIVAKDHRIVFAGEVIEDHRSLQTGTSKQYARGGLTIKAGCVSMKLLNFEKWRELPAEVRKKKPLEFN